MNRQDFFYDQLVKQMDLDLLQDNAERGIGAGLKDTWGTGLSSIDIIAHEKGTPDMDVLIPAGSARVQETGTIESTGTLTNGSPIITDIPNTARLSKGDDISGTGVPGSTKILTVDGINQVTMDKNSTADGSAVDLTITYIKYTRAVWIAEQTIDCSQDWETNSTIPAAGKECYIACYVKQKRDLWDQRQDGHDPPNTIDYRQIEGAEFRVYKGADANPASATKVSSPGSEFELVFEVLFDENTTVISDATHKYGPVKDEIDYTDVVFIRNGAKLNKAIYNTSGIFNVSAGITKLIITIFGAGGGGGGLAGGGGGGGEIFYRKSVIVTPSSDITVTIGAGGAAGSVGGGNGGDGGDSVFGALITAKGGKGGVGSSGAGGDGGGVLAGIGGATGDPGVAGNMGITQLFMSGGSGGGGGGNNPNTNGGAGGNILNNAGGSAGTGAGSEAGGGGGAAGYDGNGGDGGDSDPAQSEPTVGGVNSGAGGGGGGTIGGGSPPTGAGALGGSGGCIVEWIK